MTEAMVLYEISKHLVAKVECCDLCALEQVLATSIAKEVSITPAEARRALVLLNALGWLDAHTNGEYVYFLPTEAMKGEVRTKK